MDGIGYVCQYHNCSVPGYDACEKCMAERAVLPPVETMSREDRARELNFWFTHDQLTVSWETFMDRNSALLGRGIWRHEMAGDKNRAGLIAECLGMNPPPQSFDELIAKLPEHLRTAVIPINLSGDDSADTPN